LALQSTEHKAQRKPAKYDADTCLRLQMVVTWQLLDSVKIRTTPIPDNVDFNIKTNVTLKHVKSQEQQQK